MRKRKMPTKASNEKHRHSVADPGFPRGGGANSPGGRQHTILPYFPKNCMKLKEFGPPGRGCTSLVPPLDPPLDICSLFCTFCTLMWQSRCGSQ